MTNNDYYDGGRLVRVPIGGLCDSDRNRLAGLADEPPEPEPEVELAEDPDDCTYCGKPAIFCSCDDEYEAFKDQLIDEGRWL